MLVLKPMFFFHYFLTYFFFIAPVALVAIIIFDHYQFVKTQDLTDDVNSFNQNPRDFTYSRLSTLELIPSTTRPKSRGTQPIFHLASSAE